MIVCARCKLWMQEQESDPDSDSSGKIVRYSFKHKDGCPVKQEIKPQLTMFFGDD